MYFGVSQCWTATFVVVSFAHTAAAQDHPVPSWRVFRAGVGTGMIASDLRIDGQPANTLGSALAVSGEASYARSLTGHVGGVGILGLSTWPDGWATLAGEGRYRVDLAVGGALRWRFGQSRKPIRLFASLTLGPTISWIDAPVHVEIAERYSPGLGLNSGVRASLDLPVADAHGVFFSLAALTHATWLSHRTHILQSPTVAVEKYRILDVYCLVSTGYVWEQ